MSRRLSSKEHQHRGEGLEQGLKRHPELNEQMETLLLIVENKAAGWRDSRVPNREVLKLARHLGKLTLEERAQQRSKQFQSQKIG